MFFEGNRMIFVEVGAIGTDELVFILWFGFCWVGMGGMNLMLVHVIKLL